MDDTITNRTSDDPPIELKAARSVLVAGSKVFSDMLSLPQSTTTGQDGPVDVAEKMREIKPFLRLLNLTHDEGDPFEELEAEDWPVAARLADKYDSATVRALVLLQCWSWSTTAARETNAKQCRPGFYAAVELKHPHLAKVFMLRIIEILGTAGVSEVVHHRRAQFDKWVKLLKAHAAMCALESGGIKVCYNCGRLDPALAGTTWDRMMRATLHDWNASKAAMPFNGPVWEIGSELREAEKVCLPCKIAFDLFANSLDEQFRNTAPDFPL